MNDRRIWLLTQLATQDRRITFTPRNTDTTPEKFQPVEKELREMEQDGLVILGSYKRDSNSGERLFYRVPATITEYGKSYLEEHG